MKLDRNYFCIYWMHSLSIISRFLSLVAGAAEKSPVKPTLITISDADDAERSGFLIIHCLCTVCTSSTYVYVTCKTLVGSPSRGENREKEPSIRPEDCSL